MSNLGKWDGWRYSLPIQLGHSESYVKAIEWLDGYGHIADWGGGTGYAKQFVKRSTYTVIDGSKSLASNLTVDLAKFDGESECILLRHVLEHNYNWQDILVNVIKNFARRAAIVTFMPFEYATILDHEESSYLGSIGESVPVLRLYEDEFLTIVDPYLVYRERLGMSSASTPDENIFYLEKHD